MVEDDIVYFRVRRLQEVHAAENATNMCCRKAHLELARLYALRVTELVPAERFNAEEAHIVLSLPPRQSEL